MSVINSLYAPGPVHSFPDCIVISAAAASQDALLLLPVSQHTVFLAMSTSNKLSQWVCLPCMDKGPSPARRTPSFRHLRSPTPFGPRLRQHSSQQLVRHYSRTAVVGSSPNPLVARWRSIGTRSCQHRPNTTGHAVPPPADPHTIRTSPHLAWPYHLGPPGDLWRRIRRRAHDCPATGCTPMALPMRRTCGDRTPLLCITCLATCEDHRPTTPAEVVSTTTCL